MKRFRVLPGFYFIAAISFLLFPFRWCIAWLFAAVIHELSHIAMLKICHCQVLSITVGPGGAMIESDCDSTLKKFLCTAAGPIGGSLILLFSGVMPRAAICALIQSGYNLLPLSSLDGGRSLKYMIYMLMPQIDAEFIMKIVEGIVIAGMFGAALYGTICLHLGLMPWLIISILLLKNKNALAKNSPNEYNREHKYRRGYSYGRSDPANSAYCAKASTVYRR